MLKIFHSHNEKIFNLCHKFCGTRGPICSPQSQHCNILSLDKKPSPAKLLLPRVGRLCLSQYRSSVLQVPQLMWYGQLLRNLKGQERQAKKRHRLSVMHQAGHQKGTSTHHYEVHSWFPYMSTQRAPINQHLPASGEADVLSLAGLWCCRCWRGWHQPEVKKHTHTHTHTHKRLSCVLTVDP
jgi:hypothetical protein